MSLGAGPRRPSRSVRVGGPTPSGSASSACARSNAGSRSVSAPNVATHHPSKTTATFVQSEVLVTHEIELSAQAADLRLTLSRQHLDERARLGPGQPVGVRGIEVCCALLEPDGAIEGLQQRRYVVDRRRRTDPEQRLHVGIRHPDGSPSEPRSAVSAEDPRLRLFVQLELKERRLDRGDDDALGQPAVHTAPHPLGPHPYIQNVERTEAVAGRVARHRVTLRPRRRPTGVGPPERPGDGRGRCPERGRGRTWHRPAGAGERPCALPPRASSLPAGWGPPGSQVRRVTWSWWEVDPCRAGLPGADR